MKNFLREVLKSTRRRVKEEKSREPIEVLKEKITAVELASDFLSALSGEGVKIIAEFKRSSPSAGEINSQASLEEFLKAYEEEGVDAVSVLTEPDYFSGSMEHLRTASEMLSIPVLRKDFIVDSYQIFQSRAYGASSVLIIVRAISSDEELNFFIALARTLGMEPLVEVHDEDDLQRAVDSGARIIGVNSRDLETFHVDVDRAVQLIKEIPEGRIKVAESGISGPDEAEKFLSAGAKAFLIGTYLMKSNSPREALRSIRSVVK